MGDKGDTAADELDVDTQRARGEKKESGISWKVTPRVKQTYTQRVSHITAERNEKGKEREGGKLKNLFFNSARLKQFVCVCVLMTQYLLQFVNFLPKFGICNL